MTPPIDWFRDPQLDGPTPPKVTPEGRIYGHIATWDTPHIGMPGRTMAPRSRYDYGYFHVGETTALDGDTPVDISCGKLTLDTGHPSTDPEVTAAAAAAHYDNTGTAVASVCAGEDAYGIWFSGVVDSDLDELRLRKLRRSEVSGDWRPVEGPKGASTELVAALMVNTPGFPLPRARVASAAELVPIVAAGVVPNPAKEDTVSEAPKYTLVDGTQADELTKYALVEVTASGAVGEVDHVDDDVVAVTQLVNRADIKPASVDQAIAASAARTERQKMRTIESRLEQLTAALEARDRADQAAALLADIDV